jgi:hypothetical protein
MELYDRDDVLFYFDDCIGCLRLDFMVLVLGFWSHEK